jgi:hypothetical protein
MTYTFLSFRHNVNKSKAFGAPPTRIEVSHEMPK